jgi:hypothetical protein
VIFSLFSKQSDSTKNPRHVKLTQGSAKCKNVHKNKVMSARQIILFLRLFSTRLFSVVSGISLCLFGHFTVPQVFDGVCADVFSVLLLACFDGVCIQ